jgi:hypoxanthine phosphoribosyltransferase
MEKSKMGGSRNIPEQHGKLVLTWDDIHSQISCITQNLVAANWRPEYVVGLVRGGTIPATMISHYFNIPMHTLKVSFRDDEDTESNCWMAEDAYNRLNILVVDDINDSGKTLNWLMKDWEGGCFPNDEAGWKKVWGHSVRFLSLVNNATSKSQVQYTGMTINKAQNNVWIEFPWENWWVK